MVGLRFKNYYYDICIFYYENEIFVLGLFDIKFEIWSKFVMFYNVYENKWLSNYMYNLSVVYLKEWYI